MAARFPEDDSETGRESSEDEMNRTDPKAKNYTTDESSNPRFIFKEVIPSLKYFRFQANFK